MPELLAGFLGSALRVVVDDLKLDVAHVQESEIGTLILVVAPHRVIDTRWGFSAELTYRTMGVAR